MQSGQNPKDIRFYGQRLRHSGLLHGCEDVLYSSGHPGNLFRSIAQRLQNLFGVVTFRISCVVVTGRAGGEMHGTAHLRNADSAGFTRAGIIGSAG